jgi:hypothetical protein
MLLQQHFFHDLYYSKKIKPCSLVGGCESSVVGCGCSCWSVRHATCLAGRYACLPSYLPQFT